MSDLPASIADNPWLADNALSPDGLEAAIIGTAARGFAAEHVLVCSANKIVKIFMERDGMSEEEAWEFFHFNVEGGWSGDGTPIWMYEV